jgi:hypothetical protein
MAHTLYIFTTGTQNHSHTVCRFQSHELRIYKLGVSFVISKAALSVPHLAVRGTQVHPLARRNSSPVSIAAGTIARRGMSGRRHLSEQLSC